MGQQGLCVAGTYEKDAEATTTGQWKADGQLCPTVDCANNLTVSATGAKEL